MNAASWSPMWGGVFLRMLSLAWSCAVEAAGNSALGDSVDYLCRGTGVGLGRETHLTKQAVLYLPPLHLSTFVLGILLARWQRLRQGRAGGEAARLWQVYLVLGLSIGGVVLSVLLLPYFRVSMPYNNGLLAPVLAGVIWAVSARTTWLSRWLCGSWLVALGNASYAIYLIHGPLLLVFLYFGWASRRDYPVYLALCLGLSLLSFFYFETPVRLRLLARFHTRTLETMEEASIAQ